MCSQSINTFTKHFVNENSIHPPWLNKHKLIEFGMGCFWGAEQKFWQAEGVYVTAVGYSAGKTKNPSYESVCSENTGYAETVRVVYDVELVTLQELLKLFWESHNPTQGMRQGHDLGSQYRSIIVTNSNDQFLIAEASRISYQKALNAKGYGTITTEIINNANFYYAEDYHQQYLAKNIGGYCGLGGTGVSFP